MSTKIGSIFKRMRHLFVEGQQLTSNSALKKLKVLKRIIDARVGELNAENHIFCLRNSCPVKEPSHEPGRYQRMFRLQEEARNIAREIDDRMRRYAAAQCLPICTTVCAKLPRELRDMIYQYIIGESIVRIDKKVLKSFLFCSEIGVTPMCPAGFPNRTNIAYEHLWDRDYSGKLFYSEFIEAWYRNTTFSFVECRLVPDFLNDPRFGYGVPPREWVRKIKIIRITTTESVLSIYRGEEKAYNIKTGDLDNLKHLPKLTRVIFDFDAAFTSLPTYHDNYRRFVLTDLKEMFPKIQDLLDRECRVSVVFSSMGPLEMRREELTSQIWEEKLEAIRPD
ncbi:hypothetical protein J4E83_010837 [Alternaria metachromatica]|uniref:uncharacterized protein n=1 Tax=Alternaria metachromatica TaxID=283354 RepID=UPI0020C46CCD|nr:uncharacterized protein J4E83_010837 [Alternaria metachromatica]KAI4605102.1 hypothetical protein J4E83_010837 [Alternaria metachromatica]